MDENRQTVIGLVALSLALCCFLFWFFSAPKPAYQPAETPTGQSMAQNGATGTPTGGGKPGPGSPGTSGGGSTIGGTKTGAQAATRPSGGTVSGGGGHSSGSTGEEIPSRLSHDTEAQVAARRAEFEEDLQNLRTESMAWLKEHVNDPNLADNTKEVYRLRMLEGFRGGVEAMDAKDYAEAYEQFAKVLKDPDASPVSQFQALNYMREAAAKQKDLDKYCETYRLQGDLIANNDLSVVGVQKNPYAKEFCADIVDHLKAGRDSTAFENLVDKKHREAKGSADRTKIAEGVRKEIQNLSRVFQ